MIRTTISPEQINAQKAVCAQIYDLLHADLTRPLAMVDTYGCQQNEADSEKLRGYLAEMGYAFTQNEFEADVIVVNTCAVREHAEMRVLGNVGALNHTKKARPSQIIAVCGCMVQQEHMAEKLKKSYPVVDLVFGPHELWRFPELLLEVMTKHRRLFATAKSEGSVAEGIPATISARTALFPMYAAESAPVCRKTLSGKPVSLLPRAIRTLRFSARMSTLTGKISHPIPTLPISSA